MIGVLSIICMITVVSTVNLTLTSAEEPPVQDGDDPGNSPGPGLPPELASLIDSPFELTKDCSNVFS